MQKQDEFFWCLWRSKMQCWDWTLSAPYVQVVFPLPLYPAPALYRDQSRSQTCWVFTTQPSSTGESVAVYYNWTSWVRKSPLEIRSPWIIASGKWNVNIGNCELRLHCKKTKKGLYSAICETCNITCDRIAMLLQYIYQKNRACYGCFNPSQKSN